MIRKLALVLTLIGGLVAGIVPALAQNPQYPNNVIGQYVASEYGKWSVTTLTAMTAGTANTVNFYPCFVKVGTGNRFVFPFWQNGVQALNVAVQIQDGSNSEAITSESGAAYPSAAPPSYPQPYICSITITPTNAHNAGVTITSGDGGFAEALNDALSNGGTTVVLDPSFGSYSPNSAVPYQGVAVLDYRGPAAQNWNILPSTTTALAAPTVLAGQVACDATHQFCSDSTVAGSASWSGTIYGCYTLVDIDGNESPCSATNSYTSVVSKAIDMGVSFTARTDNVVGWKPYSSVNAGSYALAYSWPLLTQPATLGAVPVSAGVCTLTTLETVTPACAIANSTYGQAGSTVGAGTLFKGGAQFTSYPVVTNTLAPEIGSASALQHNPNEEAHATYAYVPSARIPNSGIQSTHFVFPITAAAQTTIGQVEATIPLPANYMNYVGRTIEVCGLIAKTSTVADTIDEIQVWWDAEGSNVTAGTPVELSSIKLTEATSVIGPLAAAANFQFCQQLTTTVASTTATGGTIQPGQGWMTVGQVSAGANSTGAVTSLVAAVGSLNLALPAHLSVELKHTTGTDGAGSTLQGATVRLVN